MAKKIKAYKDIVIEDRSDLVAEPQYELFFNWHYIPISYPQPEIYLTEYNKND